tara:strand:+ start:6727 stop:7233 length:507 start_codon:yes stop_codon:yes gene_type:complete
MLHTIYKDSNYSSIIPSIHTGISEMYGTFNIDSSCKYDLAHKPICSKDTNKLIGFSYGLTLSSHKKWAIRIGWRIVSNNLLLFLYVYKNGVRTITRLGYPKTFKFDTEYNFQIINDRETNTATVKVGDHFISIPFDKPITWGVILKPYFGKDCPAPHNMHIDINYTTF